jgi:hypothetical protein
MCTKNRLKKIYIYIQLTTIREAMKKFITTGTMVNLPGSGPTCISSPRAVRKMVWEAKKRAMATVGELQNLVTSWGCQVSKSRIRRHLHANRLFGRVAIEKPLLRETNKCKRLEFGKRHWHLD